MSNIDFFCQKLNCGGAETALHAAKMGTETDASLHPYENEREEHFSQLD